MINIILHEPEMPANTGNIGRTCVALGARLHLIRPLGFFLDAKSIKRAGLDYWPKLNPSVYDDFEDFRRQHPGVKIYMVSTKARQTYDSPRYEEDCYFMFGKESAGIPEEILLEYADTAVRIPMLPDIRSLNLSNAAAIVAYEAARQHGFAGLELQGELHRHKWDEAQPNCLIS